MNDVTPQDFLDECEREQLHRVQAIQPHGALLGGSTGETRIRFASANLADWIGRPAEQAVGAELIELLPGFPPQPSETSVADFGARPVRDDAWMHPLPDKPVFRRLLNGPRGDLDGILSCNESNWLLELEPALPPALRQTAYRPVPHRLYRMAYNEIDWAEQCQFLVDEIRAATGFERVMLYRFRDDECGEVISESLVASLSPYLGLRYPASDIPQIARNLYLANRHRQIPDVRAEPVPILGDGGPTDLSLSDLRAVSPVHIQYLKNMGVTASLSFSLVLGGRLWGLIACHHRTARSLPLRVRERCAEMAQVFTLAISAYLSNQRLIEVTASDRAISRLRDAMREAELSLEIGQASGQPAHSQPALGRALLSLVGAEGAALVEEHRVVTFGLTPNETAIREQADWLRETNKEAIFATDALPRLLDSAAAWADRASGLLAVRIGRFDAHGQRSERCFLWWRPEQPRTVYWAGDPQQHATYDAQSQRLSPRSSFEQWAETTSGHSEPWTEADQLRAKKFRSLVLHEINADLLRGLG